MTSRELLDPHGIQLTVTIEFTDEYDSALHIKINPKHYFYGYGCDRADDTYNEEEDLGYENFQRRITKIKMLEGESYKTIFGDRFIKGLGYFLKTVQAEAALEDKEGVSLEKKLANDEEIIFEYVKKKGPGMFRYNAVIDKVQHWCDEKDYENLEKLTMALKEYGRSFCGSVPYSSFDQRYSLVLNYKRILENIRAFKKAFNAKRKIIKDDKKLKNEIIGKWAHELRMVTFQNKRCFEILLKIAKEEEAKSGTGFIQFIEERSARELAIGIFAYIICKGPELVAKILQDKENIMKKMDWRYDLGEHWSWMDLDLH